MDYCIFPTRNLLNYADRSNSGITLYRNLDIISKTVNALPAGKYAVNIKIDTDVNYSVNASYFRVCSSSSYSTSSIIFERNVTLSTRYFTFEVNEEFRSLWIFARNNVTNSATQNLTVYYIQLEKIDDLSEPLHKLIPSITNSDYIARERIYLEPSNDPGMNRLNIQGMLNYYGYCNLGPGIFHVDSTIEMPKYTKLSGQGEDTKLISDSPMGSIVGISSRCTVENISFIGSESNIELDGNFSGKYVEEDSSVNIWPNNTSYTVDSYIHWILSTPIEPGAYAIVADVSTTGSSPYISFSSDTGGNIGPSNIISTATMLTNRRSVRYVYLDRTIYSVRLTSSDSVSSGITSTWSNIRMYPVGGKIGISCMSNQDEAFSSYIINNCFFSHFNCAGIWVINTGTPVDKNLVISNCVMYNNNVGIFLVKDAEFARISNCSIYRNYIGYYNRGGNNNIDTCGIDANVIGILIDDIVGSNGGHGTICNCSINHSNSNTGYGLIISGTGRMLVSNCNIYFSKIKLENTDGNVISNCGFGRSAGWEIVGGRCSIFTNCMLLGISSDYTPITVTDNTDVKVINCYTRSGTLVPQPV